MCDVINLNAELLGLRKMIVFRFRLSNTGYDI